MNQEINYDDPEVQKGPLKTTISNVLYGNTKVQDGHLRLKVFQIMNPKKTGTGADSDNEAS